LATKIHHTLQFSSQIAIMTSSATVSNNLHQSDLFVIKETACSGRAVFASQSLKANTLLLCSNVISASVVLREYRGEICTHCFRYERGRKFKHRLPETGTSFCSAACQKAWEAETGDDGMAAWQALESFIKAKMKTNLSGVSNLYDYLPDADTTPPTEEEIRQTWDVMESTAHFTRQARAGSKAKPHRRAIQAALTILPNADILSFQLSGILARAKNPPTAWDALTELVPDSRPYDRSEELKDHVHAYLHLLALLPTTLIPHITAENCIELARRESWNSFGLRSLDDGGDEFFGFGVWPEASFFNHSCEPNVRKERVGRNWKFWSDRDVEMDGQLSISYLGGEEKDLRLEERRKRLMATWGFNCTCSKCLDEEKDMEEIEEGEALMEGIEVSSEGTMDGIEIGGDGI
jgi:hypothetical protein